MSNISGGATNQMILDWFSLKPIEKTKCVPRSTSKPVTNITEHVPLYKFKSQYRRSGFTSNSDREYQFSNTAVHERRSQASDFAPINAPPPISKHLPITPDHLQPNMTYLQQVNYNISS